MKIFLTITLIASVLAMSGCASKKKEHVKTHEKKVEVINKVETAKPKVQEIAPAIIQNVESEVEESSEIIEEPSVDAKESTVK